jgi:hypothetical protein
MFMVIINEANESPLYWGPLPTHDAALKFMTDAVKSDYLLEVPNTTYQIVRLYDPATGD